MRTIMCIIIIFLSQPREIPHLLRVQLIVLLHFFNGYFSQCIVKRQKILLHYKKKLQRGWVEGEYNK